MSFYLNFYIYLIFNLFSFLECLNSHKVIYIPFKTKNLRLDYENEDIEYIEERNININASSFLNKWFYNDIYSHIQIGTPIQYMITFYDFNNSYFSIDKCDPNKESLSYTLLKDNLINSKSFNKKEIKDENSNYEYTLGNENFHFYDSSNYYSTININKDYNGLNLLYNDNNLDNNKLYGNIGLNININKNKNIN